MIGVKQKTVFSENMLHKWYAPTAKPVGCRMGHRMRWRK